MITEQQKAIDCVNDILCDLDKTLTITGRWELVHATPEQRIRMMEAKADITRAIKKLEKVVEMYR